MSVLFYIFCLNVSAYTVQVKSQSASAATAVGSEVMTSVSFQGIYSAVF